MIELREVTKRYGKQNVFQQITLDLPSEGVVGLIGRNGAGKSTLLKMIAGHLRPTSGDVLVDQERSFGSVRVATRTVLVDETFNLLPTTPLSEGFDLLKRAYPKWDEALAHQLANHFKLPLDRTMDRLSTGMKATYRLLCGICIRADVTLLDEPMNGMDATVREEMIRFIVKESIHYPRLFVLSSHHMEEIDALLSHVVLLHDRKIQFVGEADDLREKYVVISGAPDRVANWLQPLERSIDYTQPFVHVTIERQQLERLDEKPSSVTVRALPLNEAYVHMTRSNEGGIDDVYNRAIRNV